jgi:hypothetical protein
MLSLCESRRGQCHHDTDPKTNYCRGFSRRTLGRLGENQLEFLRIVKGRQQVGLSGCVDCRSIGMSATVCHHALTSGPFCPARDLPVFISRQIAHLRNKPRPEQTLVTNKTQCARLLAISESLCNFKKGKMLAFIRSGSLFGAAQFYISQSRQL